MKKMVIFLGVLCLLLSGCGRARAAVPLCTVATHIDVERHCQAGTVRFRFVDSQKVESVLLYLRMIRNQGRAGQEALHCCLDAWRIAVHRSDGSQIIYVQKGDRYLWESGHPWALIDPHIGSRLPKLIALFPADKML